jgi:hypothetical protein
MSDLHEAVTPEDRKMIGQALAEYLPNAQGMAAAACAPKNDQTACSPSPWPPCYASSVKI